VRLNGRLQTASDADYKWGGTTATPYIGSYGNTFHPYSGTIQEIIMLSKTGNSDMPVDDVQKIQTYLALKYGITLNSSDDYIASDGTAVWTYDAAYNNNIFGVGRDDASGLNQMQSKSSVNDALTVFLGSSLTTLNSQSNGALSNGQFLVIGSSGPSSIQPVNIPNGTVYENGNINTPNGLNFKSTAIYKAQLTGATTMTVKFAVKMDYQYAFVSKDANFTPSQTRIYPVSKSGRIAQNVIINQEYKYIMFAGYITGPGGVDAGLRLWLRADNEISLAIDVLPSTDPKLADYNFNGATSAPAVSAWSDLVRGKTYSWAAASAPSTEHRIPVYDPSNYMANYHPSVQFWSNGTYGSDLGNSSGIASVAQPANSSAYFLVNNDFNTNAWVYNLMFSSSASSTAYYEGPGYGMQKDGSNNVGRFRTSTTEAKGNANIFTPGATSILGYHQSGTNIRFRFNGQEDGTTFTWGSFDMTDPSTLGRGFTRNRTIKGVMTEAIIYEGLLSADDEQKIESYLAIKYGITLRPSTAATKRFNYTFSDGESFWNGDVANTDKYAVFYNRIAAVIRDDVADLHNAHSHSTDVGSLLHLGVAGKKLGVSGVEVGELEYDMEAVVWGDDDATGITAIGTNEVCGDFKNIFNRKWLVHKKTENNRSITMLVGAQNNSLNQLAGGGATDMFNDLTDANNVVLLVAASPDSIDDRNFRAVIPMSYIDGEHQCTYTFTDEETYITFGYMPNSKGCEGEVVFEGRLEYKWSSQWPRQSYGSSNSMAPIIKPAYIFDPSGITVETIVTYEPGIYGVNYYPQSVNSPFNGGLEIRRRRGDPGQKVTVRVIFNHPVIPNFSLADIDGYLGAFESVAVRGTCGVQTYYPALSYGGNANTSYYRITGNTATATIAKDLSQTDVNGRLNVQFESGVMEVIIEYAILSKINPNSTNILVISPISIKNMPLSPPVNEDGLSFVKDVKNLDITICEEAEVEYSFHIQNTNCDTMYINFADTLSSYPNLKWTSLSLDSVNALHNTHISVNAFENTDLLLIDSLAVPGTSTLKFTATAIFDENAPTGDYSNHAVIKYVRFINNIPTDVVTLSSRDRETLNEETTFHATWQPHPVEVELTSSISPTKYSTNSVIEVSLTVNNPNTITFTDMFLNVDWDAGFSYVDYSVAGASTGITMVTPDDPNDWARTFAGDASGTAGFSLQPGTTVIKFRLQAPAVAEEEVDDEGNTITGKKASLNANYRFTTEMNDQCVQLALSNLIGKLTVEYAGTHILLNRHITTKILK
jgi:hypothetical protein